MNTWQGDDIDPEDVVVEEEGIDPAKASFGSSPDDSSDESFRDTIAKMREELKKIRGEKQEYMDGWQRAKADYVNLLKRGEESARAAESKGSLKAVLALLPAFDALERAKSHGDMPEGFQAIVKQLEGAFVSLGLEEVGKVGEHFDPALHEAFGQDASESAEHDGKITAVLEKGWRIKEQVIRAAKVRVAST